MTKFQYPPLVEEPKIVVHVNGSVIKMEVAMAAEEDGPIKNYWLVVVQSDEASRRQPAEFEPEELRAATKDKKYHVAANISQEGLLVPNGRHHVFVGDGTIAGGFQNHPLKPDTDYRAFLRAFIVDSGTVDNRPMIPWPDPKSPRRTWSDSAYCPTFHTKVARAGVPDRDGTPKQPGMVATSAWLIGPVIAIIIVCIIIGMLIVYWMKRNSKSKAIGGLTRHGSISKVQLGPANNETQKLLMSENAYAMDPAMTMSTTGRGPINGFMHEQAELELAHMQQQQQQMNAMQAPIYPIPMMNGSATHGTLAGSGGVPGGPPPGMLAHPPIPITELAQHIERLKANDNMLFFQEYESIETGQTFTWEHSNLDVNKPKNRYANVVAYDHTRVVLSSLDGLPAADYINANYIDGYRKPKAYIATQGPLPDTFNDFWRMIWEQTCVTIVMLTRLEERTRIKCDQYWPTRGSGQFGVFTVTLADTLDLAHYTIRTLTIQVSWDEIFVDLFTFIPLQKRGETEVRDIRHLQFTAWPDHGVPDHPTPFLMFLKRVKSLNPTEAGPIVTHCRWVDGWCVPNTCLSVPVSAELVLSLQSTLCSNDYGMRIPSIYTVV
jgi:netrin-G3 ligand